MCLDIEQYERVLGRELRELRKCQGWTRKRLNARLPSTISLQTLATYELGTRRCSVVRFAEICIALGVQPHDVLARVDRCLLPTVADETADEVTVELTRVAAEASEPGLAPLRRWAAGRLRQLDPYGPVRVRLSAAAVDNLATLCDMSVAELRGRLRRLSAPGVGGDDPVERGGAAAGERRPRG